MAPRPAGTFTGSALSGRALLLLLGATALAWANGLSTPFQFDDRGVIVEAGRVHDLGRAIVSAGDGLRGLLTVSYAVSWALGGGHPLAFHLGNLAVHLVDVVLVVRLVGLALHDRRDPAAVLGTAAAAVVFALHPLQTEAVTYVSGRSSSLSTMFVLLATLTWVRGVRSGSRLRTWAVAPLLLGSAALTKETAAVLPLGLLAWDLTIERTPWRRALARQAPWVACLGVLGIAAVLHDPTYRLLLGVVGQRPLVDAVVHQLEGVAWVASRLVAAHRLSIDPGLGLQPVSAPAAAGGGLVVAALALTAVGAARRQPAVAFGAAWILVHLFVPWVLLPRVDVLNERHAYVALAGAAPAIAAAFGGALARAPARGRLTIAILALLLGAATARRNHDYRSERALWEATVRASPGNPRAHHNLGAVHEREGRLDAARASYAAALAREPGYVAARRGLARVEAAR